MSPIRLAVSALVLIAASPCLDPLNVRGSDVDELRERAANMHREVAKLVESGHEQEAAEPRKKANALLQQADRLQHGRGDSLRSRMIELLEERLQDLRNEERELEELDDRKYRLEHVRAELSRARSRLREITQHRDGPSDRDTHSRREPPPVARRLEHMRMAIEHLKQAGLHDAAAHVTRRAEELQRALHQDRQQGRKELAEMASAIDEVRREVGRLRDQVDDLMEQRTGIARESAGRTERRDGQRDPPRGRTPKQRDPEPDQKDSDGRGRDRQEKEN